MLPDQGLVKIFEMHEVSSSEKLRLPEENGVTLRKTLNGYLDSAMDCGVAQANVRCKGLLGRQGLYPQIRFARNKTFRSATNGMSSLQFQKPRPDDVTGSMEPD